MEVGEEAAASSFLCPACNQEISLQSEGDVGGPVGEPGQPPGGSLEDAPSFYVMFWGRDVSQPGPAMQEIPDEMRKLRKCANCGGRLWHRVNHGTIRYVGPTNLKQLEQMESQGLDEDQLGKTWGYGNLMVCLNCIGVDCMIEGCEERATEGIHHEFDIGESGSVLDKSFRVSMRNDLWFCPTHASRVKGFRALRMLRNGLLTIGTLGAVAVFLSESKIPAGIVAAAGLIAGGVCWQMMASFADRHGLLKKAKYIESVRVPDEVDCSDRSRKAPWVDDQLYG